MPNLPHAAATGDPCRLVMWPAEFWCSPGFEPRGGRCIATLSRDELFIYDTDAYPPRIRHHRRHQQGLRERY